MASEEQIFVRKSSCYYRGLKEFTPTHWKLRTKSRIRLFRRRITTRKDLLGRGSRRIDRPMTHNIQ
jgi:hypothetical protein